MGTEPQQSIIIDENEWVFFSFPFLNFNLFNEKHVNLIKGTLCVNNEGYIIWIWWMVHH